MQNLERRHSVVVLASGVEHAVALVAHEDPFGNSSILSSCSSARRDSGLVLEERKGYWRRVDSRMHLVAAYVPMLELRRDRCIAGWML